MRTSGCSSLAFVKSSDKAANVRSFSCAPCSRARNSGATSQTEEVSQQRGRLVADDADRPELLDDAGADLVRRHALAHAKVPAQELEDRRVGRRGAVRHAARLQLERVEPADELVEQPGLADPGLADDQDDGALAGGRDAVGVLEPGKLLPASGQRGQPAFTRDFQSRPPTHLARHRPGASRLALALERELAEVLEAEEALGQAMGLAADHDLPRLGDAEQAGREIRRVAEGGVVHAEVAADGADHHQPGVDAHPHTKLDTVRLAHVLPERLQLLLHGQGGPQGAMRVVLVRQRRPEERHDTVAQELVDRALVLVDAVEDDLEGAIHDRVNVLGVQPLGHRGEARHVGEQHGDLLALPLDGAARREDLLGQMRGRVGVRRGKARCRRLGGGGRHGGGGARGRRGRHRLAALRAELGGGRDRALAGKANRLEPLSTLTAELPGRGIVVRTAGTVHQLSQVPEAPSATGCGRRGVITSSTVQPFRSYSATCGSAKLRRPGAGCRAGSSEGSGRQRPAACRYLMRRRPRRPGSRPGTARPGRTAHRCRSRSSRRSRCARRRSRRPAAAR